MHFCPDCGEECDCPADIELLDEDCEHACKTLVEKNYDYDYEEFYNDEDIYLDDDYYY